MMSWDSPVAAASQLALAILSLAVCLCVFRLARGPSLPDRVIGLDVIAMLLVGMLVMHSIDQPEPTALRVAIVLALINFIGTVGFSIYVYRRAG